MDVNLTGGLTFFRCRNGWKYLRNAELILPSIIKDAEALMKYYRGITLIMALKNRF